MSAMALLPQEHLTGSPVPSAPRGDCWGQPRIRTDWEESGDFQSISDAIGLGAVGI